MSVCFIACLKVKYSFKKYVHDVENMPKYCADKHKHWSLYKKESTKSPPHSKNSHLCNLCRLRIFTMRWARQH